MRKGEKKLSHFFIRKFILFAIVLVLSFSIFYNLMMMFDGSTNKVLSVLSAKELIQTQYDLTDITLLQDLDGWIEILNENNEVIYTKGEVLEPKASYTQAELLEQASYKPVNFKKSFTVGGILTISSVEKEETPTYLATYHTFTGTDGQTYTGIVKIPSERLSVNYTLLNASGELGNTVFKNMLILALGTTLILGLCIFYYSKNIQKHLEKPNKALVDALANVTKGDYDTVLELEAEYEYKDIQSSFNYLTQCLKEAKKQRENYEQQREQLFSNIAHDLKTPITSIQGYAKSLNDGLVTDKLKQQEYLSTIYNKSIHLTELINRLSTYSKLNNSQYSFRFIQLDFSEFLRQIITHQLDDIEKYGDELEVEIPEHKIMISIDPIEMERVIVNLIQNAIKHNPRHTKITMTLEVETNFVCFIIKDNGVLIAPSLQSQLFEPFVCGDESRQSKQGSGLGLSICQQIIHKHNGTIEFHQECETNKYFKVTLPKT